MSGDRTPVDGDDETGVTEPRARATHDEADDPWLSDDLDESRPGIPPLAIVLVAVAVLAVIIVLVATSGGSSSPNDSAKAGSDNGGAVTSTTVKRGPDWSEAAQGRPDVFGQLHDPITSVNSDAAPGAYAWVDFDGWHLWIVAPKGKAAAKGTISSNQKLGDAHPAVDGQGTVKVDGETLSFDFSGVDAKAAGATFNLGFYATEVTINLGGTDLPLLLGKDATPSPLPAVISKQVRPN